jgi:DNA-binding MarR family transcriptional regulator
MFDRCLYFNVNSLARKVNAIWEQAFAEFDLSPSHAYLLRLVLDNPGMTQNWICEELNLEKSTVTRFINVLEKKELLARHRAGREVQVVPTTKAKKIKQKLNSKGDELYKQMLETLGKSELTDVVKRMREAGKSL